VVSADWPEDEFPAVADHEDDDDVAVESELLAIDEEPFADAAAALSAAELTAILAPSPRRAETLSASARTRDRAAAWRRRFAGRRRCP